QSLQRRQRQTCRRQRLQKCPDLFVKFRPRRHTIPTGELAYLKPTVATIEFVYEFLQREIKLVWILVLQDISELFCCQRFFADKDQCFYRFFQFFKIHTGNKYGYK